MAEVMTYPSLLTDLTAYCERANDPKWTAQLPRLVMLAENRIATDLKVEGTALVVKQTLAVNTLTLRKPAFWRDTVAFQLTDPVTGKKFNLLPRLYEYCRQCYPNPSVLGAPRFYSDYEFEHFLISPAPAAAYDFELIYHARLDPLDVTNTTNWLTTNAPQMLFYAAMVEAQTFLKNQDGVTLWAGLYKDMLDGLNKEDSGRQQDRTTVPS